MLTRAESRREVCVPYFLTWALLILPSQAIEDFIRKLRQKELSADKRRKLSQLELTEEEWTRIRLFCNVLQVCYVLFLILFR